MTGIDVELDLASNVWGAVKGDCRDRLIAVYKNPCQETWEEAYTIILNRDTLMTLWQAVIATTPDFTRSKPCDLPWEKIPTQDDIRHALKYATH